MKAGNLRISGFQFSRERVVAGSGILQKASSLPHTNALCAESIPNQKIAVAAATASTMMPSTMR